MRRILDRYILREVFLSWLAVTAVLLVILLTYQVTRVLERAAENQYPQSVVLELIWLSAVQNLPIIMPVGLLLGVVLAFGRLYHDSEMAAALACGVGPSVMYWPAAIIAGLVTVVMAALTLFIAPHSFARVLSVRSAAVQQGQFAPIAPGRFRTFGGADVVVYAEKVEDDGTLINVFVERDRGGRVEVTLAQRARHVVSANGMAHTITLYDGERFEGVPGSPKFRIMRFPEGTIPVEVPKPSDSVVRLESVTTRNLLKGRTKEDLAELHWRIAMPLMCIVLTIVALPLSRLRPREGRYSRVAIAILFYFVYVNFISAAKVWIARGSMPEWLGLWWVHVGVLGLAWLIVSGPRWLARARYKPYTAVAT
ncbi:MAG: LPS export ABC transporter permease LptF [Gammaproteobacteria bacterium]